jgi:hypothetical protein
MKPQLKIKSGIVKSHSPYPEEMIQAHSPYPEEMIRASASVVQNLNLSQSHQPGKAMPNPVSQTTRLWGSDLNRCLIPPTDDNVNETKIILGMT